MGRQFDRARADAVAVARAARAELPRPGLGGLLWSYTRSVRQGFPREDLLPGAPKIGQTGPANEATAELRAKIRGLAEGLVAALERAEGQVSQDPDKSAHFSEIEYAVETVLTE
jgi:hypothetical protein